MSTPLDSTRSSYREALVEHLLLGGLLSDLWKSKRVAEVMKPQPDHGGYDTVIDCEGIVRHVQIKSSAIGARASFQKIHEALAKKPSGCVVWVVFDPDTLEIKEYLWFGGRPGRQLPDIEELKVARHTKATAAGVKSLRPAIRKLPKSKFQRVAHTHDLVQLMFGPGPVGRANMSKGKKS